MAGLWSANLRGFPLALPGVFFSDMAWGALDDGFYDHPKVSALGPYMLACIGLHALAISYCNRHLTDGLIPKDEIPRLAGDLSHLLSEGHPWKLVERLVAVNLWEENGSNFAIHDYLDYNRSRRHVMQLRKTRAVSGQAGGLAKVKQKTKQNSSKSLPQSHTQSHTQEQEKTKTGTPTKRGVLGDQEFLDALRSNPAYKRLDIDQELGMLDGWLLTPRGRGKQKTRGRIVAWLNRAVQDLPLGQTPEKEEPYGFER